LYAIPFFEARRLKPNQIQRRHTKAFVAWLATSPTAAERREKVGLRRPLSPRTIAKHLAPVKAMFSDAVEDDQLTSNPAKVRVNVTSAEVPEDGGEARAFIDEQLAGVLDAAGDEDRLLFDAVAATGARWGELCEWRGRDLATGPDGPVLRVRRAFSDKARDAEGKRLEIVKLPKSDKGRRDLPVEPDLARRLWRLQRGPDELLFQAPGGGRMDYSNAYKRILKPTLKAASDKHGEDLTWAAWHTFRHTVASRLFAAGRNVKQVQEWLGHHKASFTLDTYVHLMGGGIGEALPLPEIRTEVREGGQQGANKGPETAVNADLPETAESGGLQA
jgi:integrase